MRLTIYGAGLAGLLAATVLRRYKPIILEAQSSLPHNHDALLRFRSDAVARATGIPFRKVKVTKGVYRDGAIYNYSTVRDNNLYSHKVTGRFSDRSIWNLETVERWIAPPNLISLLAEGLDISYGIGLREAPKAEPSISTMPMPILMGIMKWEEPPVFAYRSVTVLSFSIEGPETDLYQTLYFPSKEDAPYRASITGDRVMIEMAGEVKCDCYDMAEGVLNCFGIHGAKLSDIEAKIQRYGKISPIPEEVRREFILAMSDKYKIYSLGRYATWRNILLDDVVDDLRTVENLISQRDNYSKRLTQLNQI